MSGLPGVTRPTSQMIADRLVAEIRGGGIVTGAPLPTERELCDRFGVSRPTIREALVSLQIRGFISSGNGKRPRVTRPSLAMILMEAGASLRDALGDTESGASLEQMRQFIEVGAAREAARHATSLQIARLKGALDENFSAIGTGDFSQTDIDFHVALVAVLTNPVIHTLHQLFVSQILALRPHAADPAHADRRTFDEHCAVFQAILDGDAVKATDLLDEHLSRSYRKRMAFPAHSTPSEPPVSNDVHKRRANP